MDKRRNEITGDSLNKLHTLIDKLFARKDSIEFRYPVDYIGLGRIWSGLTDYKKIIKKMMDLSTVKKKLNDEEYSTVEECLGDLQLIWDNCKLYNVEFSKIYKMSVRLEDFQSRQVKELFPSVDCYGKENPSFLTLKKLKSMNLMKINPKEEE